MDRRRKPGRWLQWEAGRGWMPLFPCLLITLALLPTPTRGQTETGKPEKTLQGELLVIEGTGPVLRAAGKDYPLSARTSWLLHTLEDKRLLNREICAEGSIQPDGSFKVMHFYTVKNGKLFRVRYFCEVCNIEALEPGNCVCCQQPTELQEIPVPDSQQRIP